jgi:hypothetical protein
VHANLFDRRNSQSAGTSTSEESEKKKQLIAGCFISNKINVQLSSLAFIDEMQTTLCSIFQPEN